MPEFDSREGSALRRFIVCLGAAAVCLTLGVVGLSATGVAHLLPLNAEAAQKFEADWTFAEPAINDLNAAAIQVCAAENAAKAAKGTANEDVRNAQVEVLTEEYRLAEQAYNQQVRALIQSGNRRPWTVPTKALPLDLARSRVCLKVAKAAERPTSRPDVQVPGQPGRFLTLEQLDAYAALAGWPNEPGWWPEMRKIILCETRSLDTMAHNTSDPNGGSYGLAQLNGSYHFERAGEDFGKRFDPVVNLRTALWLRTARGHFGGFGGWANCAALWGIE